MRKAGPPSWMERIFSGSSSLPVLHLALVAIVHKHLVELVSPMGSGFVADPLTGPPLADRPSFKHGVYVQEVFAGWAGWSAGMVQAGFRAAPPVEYFEDPLYQSGPKPEFDLRDPTVRSAR